MAMSAAAQDHQDLVLLRDVIIQYPVAINRWSQVVDRVVLSAEDARRIKKLLGIHDFAEAVLQTLETWQEYGRQRADLLQILRALNLNALAERLNREAGHLLRYTSHELSSKPSFGDFGPRPCWCGVGELVYNFTGRKKELGFILDKFAKARSQPSGNATSNVVWISGLGGVGKSTLARKYAHEARRRSPDLHVAWINAETAYSMRESFQRLVADLGLRVNEQSSNEELAAKVYDHFKQRKCLFIFDNVEEKKDFDAFRPRVHPGHVVPDVLVTSRMLNLGLLPENRLPLDVLMAEEAIDLIKLVLPTSSLANAERLARALGNLPLALQQAIAYIRAEFLENDEAIPKYLTEFEAMTSTGVRLLGDETYLEYVEFEEQQKHKSTTLKTWSITFEKLKDIPNGPSALEMIETLAYLNPDWITVHFSRALFSGTEEERALRLLERFSMVQVTEGRVLIHRLVQWVVRLSLSPPSKEERILSTIVSVTKRQFEVTTPPQFDPQIESTSHGLHLLQLPNKRFEPGVEEGDWPWRSLLCHWLLNYGHFEDSKAVAEQSTVVFTARRGADHESTLTMKFHVGKAAFALRECTEASQILDETLSVVERNFGDLHPLTMQVRLALIEVEARAREQREKTESLVLTVVRILLDLFRNFF